MLDRDGNGSITLEEIASALAVGKEADEDTFARMIGEMDIDGDGVITIKEFEYIMNQLLLN